MAIAHAPVMTDEDFQKNINDVNARYQKLYDETGPEQDDIKKDAENCVAEFALDVKWDMTKVAFDIPEVKFKMREMKFHFVKTSFNNKTVAVFEVPEFRWEITKIGPIKTKVPKWYSKRVEIKTKIPEFKWDVTSIKTKVPEFFKKRIEIKFHILKIMGLKELNVPCKSAEKKSEAFQKKMNGIVAAHQSEIYELSSGYLSQKADIIADQMDDTAGQFDQALADMDSAIAEVRKNGVDPGALTTDFEGEAVSLLKAREIIAQKKAQALEDLAVAHKEVLDAIAQLR